MRIRMGMQMTLVSLVTLMRCQLLLSWHPPTLPYNISYNTNRQRRNTMIPSISNLQHTVHANMEKQTRVQTHGCTQLGTKGARNVFVESI